MTKRFIDVATAKTIARAGNPVACSNLNGTEVPNFAVVASKNSLKTVWVKNRTTGDLEALTDDSTFWVPA